MLVSISIIACMTSLIIGLLLGRLLRTEHDNMLKANAISAYLKFQKQHNITEVHMPNVVYTPMEQIIEGNDWHVEDCIEGIQIIRHI